MNELTVVVPPFTERSAFMVPPRLRAIPTALSTLVILLACTGDSFAGPDEAGDDPTPGVTSLAVKPDSVDLSPGETRQFTARGIDEAGDTVAVDAAWSATTDRRRRRSAISISSW